LTILREIERKKYRGMFERMAEEQKENGEETQTAQMEAA
jgi:hypothetical protein